MILPAPLIMTQQLNNGAETIKMSLSLHLKAKLKVFSVFINNKHDTTFSLRFYPLSSNSTLLTPDDNTSQLQDCSHFKTKFYDHYGIVVVKRCLKMRTTLPKTMLFFVFCPNASS